MLTLSCTQVKILMQAKEFAQCHGQAALVTVIGVKGSTPRHVGAHMLVADDGTIVGSIGGGRVEWEVVQVATQVASGGKSKIVQHDLVKDLAMCCGGSMELYIEALGQVLPVIEELLLRHKERKVSFLESNLALGGKVMREEKGGEAIGKESPDLFLEEFLPSPRLILFGCGHLARAIGPLAKSLGFEVVVCDDNETGRLERNYQWADTVVSSFHVFDLQRSVGGLGKQDYLLVLSRDHAIDQQIIERLLPQVTDFAYLGLIGSLGKVGRFKKRIFAKGIAGEKEWKHLHAPIGLDIAAETPEEIAVSIMAEIVLLKNKVKRA